MPFSVSCGGPLAGTSALRIVSPGCLIRVRNAIANPYMAIRRPAMSGIPHTLSSLMSKYVGSRVLTLQEEFFSVQMTRKSSDVNSGPLCMWMGQKSGFVTGKKTVVNT